MCRERTYVVPGCRDEVFTHLPDWRRHVACLVAVRPSASVVLDSAAGMQPMGTAVYPQDDNEAFKMAPDASPKV